MSDTTGYDKIASNYAASIDTKPIRIFYERPATLSLLPRLEGLTILDAGCGSGWYCEHYLQQGSSVTAIDLNAEFVALTKARVQSFIPDGKAKVLQGDLGQGLGFPDSSFDLIVSPLVMHYLKDWTLTLSEFYRVLKPDGSFVFSTHHPSMTRELFKLENYFETVLIEDDWKIGKVYYYHRAFTDISKSLFEAGFVIERVLEPLPQEAFKEADPKWFEKLSKHPWFLFIRARKT
jgi:SAM-dependent methyltransferase